MATAAVDERLRINVAIADPGGEMEPGSGHRHGFTARDGLTADDLPLEDRPVGRSQTVVVFDDDEDTPAHGAAEPDTTVADGSNHLSAIDSVLDTPIAGPVAMIRGTEAVQHFSLDGNEPRTGGTSADTIGDGVVIVGARPGTSLGACVRDVGSDQHDGHGHGCGANPGGHR